MDNYQILTSATSTNSVLKTMNIDELPPFFMLIAQQQTAGRGRGNNTWESEPDKNLLASILLKPQIAPYQQFNICRMVSLAVCKTLTDYCRIEHVKIKWPNDIYVCDKKIAGILIEHQICGNTIKYSIIGIGLNVNQTSFSPAIPNPTSIALAIRHEFDTLLIGRQIVDNIKFYNNLAQDRLEEDYLRLIYRLNETSHFIIKQSGACIAATIQGVSSNGCLTLLMPDNSLQNFELNELQYVL